MPAFEVVVSWKKIAYLLTKMLRLKRMVVLSGVCAL